MKKMGNFGGGGGGGGRSRCCFRCLRMAAWMMALTLAANILSDGNSAEAVQRDGKILILTEKDYDMATKYYSHVLVTFHASWCGICDKFKRDLKAASLLLAEDPNKRVRKVKLAMVDGDKEKNLVKRFGIYGFPNVKFYVYGNPMDYKGGMGAKRIVKWIKRKLKKMAR